MTNNKKYFFYHSQAGKSLFMHLRSLARTAKHSTMAVMMVVSLCFLVVSCSDDDDFSTSSSLSLTMGSDTISFDTTFSATPTPTKTFWVYNRSGKSLRLSNVRLERGNQTGYRVNVNGTFLGQNAGWQANDIEVRNKDSIRVFVELTSPLNGKTEPQLVQDNLLFTLESGVVQKVNLRAWSWDAVALRNLYVSEDSIIRPGKPYVVYGGITVDSTATLTIEAGTTLYFHADAGMKVYGRLLTKGTPDSPVILRGDRLDNMFDYLPYDRVSGQWQGLTFTSSSYDNILEFTDIHSTFNGVLIDSSDVSKNKITLSAVTIHNCQGYGMYTDNSNVTLENCVISNTLDDCLYVGGGRVLVNNCTLAQFYPFDSRRGMALRFEQGDGLDTLRCTNSIITGYAEDVVMRVVPDSTMSYAFAFDHCIMRTPVETTADSIRFTNILYELPDDTTAVGKRHFVNIDEENLYYDFRLDSLSLAVGFADAESAAPSDRNGTLRDDTPDAGAYEYPIKANSDAEEQKTAVRRKRKY